MTTELIEEPKTVTFSLRIGEELIEEAKQEARRISYEEGQDISYTDLVRQYIENGIRSGIRPNLLKEEPEWLKFVQFNNRQFWTEARRKAFMQTETAKNIQECIDSNNWCYIVELGREVFEYAMDNFGIARKVLVVDKELQPKPWQYERQLAALAWVRNRRGSVPEAIMEQEQILVPGFEVCSNPEISNGECTPITLFEALLVNIYAVVKEIDHNVISLLNAAADGRGKFSGLGFHPSDPEGHKKDNPFINQIIKVKNFIPRHITSAIQQIVQHSIVAEYIIVRPDDYVKFHEWGKDYLDAPPLKEALKTRNYGSIMGAKILVSDRIRDSKIYVITDPESLGVLVNKQKIQIEPKSHPNKLRKGIVTSVEIGMLICNDYGVAVIEKVADEDVK